MSAVNPTGILSSYFSVKDLRNIVDITDTLDDVELGLLGSTANTEVTTLLYPFSAQMPLTGDYLTMAQNATLYRVAALWKAKKNNKELADFYNSQFKSTIAGLIESLKANRNVRTQRVSVQQNYSAHLTYAQLRKF